MNIYLTISYITMHIRCKIVSLLLWEVPQFRPEFTAQTSRICAWMTYCIPNENLFANFRDQTGWVNIMYELIWDGLRFWRVQYSYEPSLNAPSSRKSHHISERSAWLTSNAGKSIVNQPCLMINTYTYTTLYNTFISIYGNFWVVCYCCTGINSTW